MPGHVIKEPKKFSQTKGDRMRDSKGRFAGDDKHMVNSHSRRKESTHIEKLWKKAKSMGRNSIKGLKL